MTDLPQPIADHLLGLTAGHAVCIEVDAVGRIMRISGPVDRYGLGGLEAGELASDGMDCLHGLLPVGGEPILLPLVNIAADEFVDLHVIPAGATSWVVIVDATEQAERRRMMQQRGNELALARRELERQRDRIGAQHRELKQFSYFVSHDLRAPLRRIERILGEFDDGDPVGARTAIDEIRDALNESNQLIEDLLQLAAVGEQPETGEAVDLGEIAREVAREFHDPPARLASVEGRWPVRMISGSLLRQILRNLIENGLKYNDAATPTVRVSCTISGTADEVTVEDNGIGFAARDTDRIFEAFRRLHASDVYPGTGIGLAIVRKAAEAMGGTVEARSEAGRGSVFVIRLPIAGDA